MWAVAPRVGFCESVLFEEVFNIGAQKIKCIDNVFDLITHLKKKHEATYGAHVEFIFADARKLQDVFKEPCFDTIFDKGTFDCILAGDVSVNHATKYLEEMNRILTNNGTFIVLSCLDMETSHKYFKKVAQTEADELENQVY
jgi:ubiquinone/menaquinone biosynthesis C-methylase UbiE